MKKDEPVASWLDRLILDESLGGLDEDTRSLLQAYAAEHPHVEALRGEAHEVAALACRLCRALPDEAPAPRPAPPRVWHILHPLSAAAAALVIGLGLGLLMGRAPVRVARPTGETPLPQSQAAAMPLARAITPATGGWDSVAWYQKAREQRRAASPWSTDRAAKDTLMSQWRRLR